MLVTCDRCLVYSTNKTDRHVKHHNHNPIYINISLSDELWWPFYKRTNWLSRQNTSISKMDYVFYPSLLYWSIVKTDRDLHSSVCLYMAIHEAGHRNCFVWKRVDVIVPIMKRSHILTATKMDQITFKLVHYYIDR